MNVHDQGPTDTETEAVRLAEQIVAHGLPTADAEWVLDHGIDDPHSKELAVLATEWW